ncbi:MAG: hypothetical protein J0M11_12795 [Anaerolineae bacterium]|nr:hypothetical protein [Anaerolineae bacterium]
MSDSIVVALIGLIGAVLAALIGAFGTIEAAKIKEKSSNSQSSGVSCGWIGLVASVMAVIGFILSAIFATSLLRNFNDQPTTVILDPLTTNPGVQTSASSVPAQIFQTGPYWGWRNEFGTETLMLNILSTGECIQSIQIFIDGQSYNAFVISDTNDPHYQNKSMSFEGSTGSSCNYLINSNTPIRPSQYFSVPTTTYGINLPSEKPYEWCYQSTDKTWYPCQ